MTQLVTVPVQKDFTSDEYAKLLQLSPKKSGKRFRSMQALIKDLKKR